LAEKPPEVPPDIWAEFLAVRKARRSPFTARALAGIEREAEKAGVSLTEALTTCIERGWQGYKAEWVQQNRTGSGGVTGHWRPPNDNEPYYDENGEIHIPFQPPSQAILDEWDKWYPDTKGVVVPGVWDHVPTPEEVDEYKRAHPCET